MSFGMRAAFRGADHVRLPGGGAFELIPGCILTSKEMEQRGGEVDPTPRPRLRESDLVLLSGIFKMIQI